MTKDGRDRPWRPAAVPNRTSTVWRTGTLGRVGADVLPLTEQIRGFTHRGWRPGHRRDAVAARTGVSGGASFDRGAFPDPAPSGAPKTLRPHCDEHAPSLSNGEAGFHPCADVRAQHIVLFADHGEATFAQDLQ
jgi:hypothetical protein